MKTVMTRTTDRGGRARLLGAVLLASLGTARSAAAAEPVPSSSPPAPVKLLLPDAPETEPPPAPLSPDPPAPSARLTTPAPAPPAPRPVQVPRDETSSRARLFKGVAWGGIALTLAFVTTGTVLGVLAQSRADELGRLTSYPAEGLPPVYDAAVRERYLGLQSDGQTYNRATVACFLAGGVTALASGLLFWDAARLGAGDKKLSFVPAGAGGTGGTGGTVVLSGRF